MNGSVLAKFDHLGSVSGVAVEMDNAGLPFFRLGSTAVMGNVVVAVAQRVKTGLTLGEGPSPNAAFFVICAGLTE